MDDCRLPQTQSNSSSCYNVVSDTVSLLQLIDKVSEVDSMWLGIFIISTPVEKIRRSETSAFTWNGQQYLFHVAAELC